MTLRKSVRRLLLTALLLGSTLVIEASRLPSAWAAMSLSTDLMLVAMASTTPGDYRRIYSISRTVSTAKTLVRDAGKDAWRPRLSPDRTRFLYYTGRPNHPEEVVLWLANADGTGTPSQVVNATTMTILGWQLHSSAAWSPDGNVLVMSAGAIATPQVFIYNLTTAQWLQSSTAHTDIPHLTPTFSNDQSSIFYSRCPAASPCMGTDREIYKMGALSDATDVRITTDIGTQYNDSEPVDSPDGTKLIFRRIIGCKPQIYQVSPSGGTPTAVVNDGEYNITAGWDTNNDTLYFDRMPAAGQWRLAKLTDPRSAGPYTTTYLTQQGCAEEFPDQSQNSPSAATTDPPVGQGLPMAKMLVSMTSTDGPTAAQHAMHEIYSVDAATGNNPTRITTSNGDAWWPRLTPDRRKFLFYKGGIEQYDRVSLWIYDFASGTETQIIPKAGPTGRIWLAQGHATWSPDGAWLVMFALEPALSSKLQLYRMAYPALTITPITTHQPNIDHIDPSWSPSPQDTIVYSRCPLVTPCAGGNIELFKTSSIWGDAPSPGFDTQLTSNTTRDHDAFYSPDGTWIAWLYQASCNSWGIKKISVWGGAETTLINNGEINSMPTWDRNSAAIYFHVLHSSNLKTLAYKKNLSGGAKSAVTTFTDHCGLTDPSYTAH